MTATTRTVREIALENPAAIRVFEQFGIDYCCGGRMPLSEACANKSIPIGDVLAAIERAVAGAEDHAIDFTAQPLSALAQYIVETHHAYVKREIPALPSWPRAWSTATAIPVQSCRKSRAHSQSSARN